MTSLPATERHPSWQNRTFLPTSHLSPSLPPKQSKCLSTVQTFNSRPYNLLIKLVLLSHPTSPGSLPSTEFHQVDKQRWRNKLGFHWTRSAETGPAGEWSSKTLSPPSALFPTYERGRWSKLWVWNYNPPSGFQEVVLSFALMARWDGTNKAAWLLPFKVPSVSAREPGWETTPEFTSQTPD